MRTRRALGAGWELGRPGWGLGSGGVGYWWEREPDPGSWPEGTEGRRTRLGRGESGTRDPGPALWVATSAQIGPAPHRPLFLTSQQASEPGWRRSVPSRALQLPGAELSQAPNPQRPDRPGYDPLPASSASSSASSGSPPRPRARHSPARRRLPARGLTGLVVRGSTARFYAVEREAHYNSQRAARPQLQALQLPERPGLSGGSGWSGGRGRLRGRCGLFSSGTRGQNSATSSSFCAGQP